MIKVADPRIFGRSLTIVAMIAVMALDTSDQSAIGATAPEVRSAFGIGQTQIGLLATSSTVVGVLFTLPFGVLADRAGRVRLLRVTVALWIAAMVGVGAAPRFGVMLTAHCLLGLVTGAGGPLIASVVGDLVPQARRGRVFSGLLLGELGGSVFGLAVSGEVAALISWRWAYWILAVAGICVFALLVRAVEPARSALTAGAGRRSTVDLAPEETEMSLREAIVVLLRNRTLVLLVLASALGYYFFAGVQTFAVSLLTEAYGVTSAVAPVLVLLIGASLAAGVLIGGPAGDRLLRKQLPTGRLPLLVVAFAGSLAFIVPAFLSSHLLVVMPLLITGGVLLGMANPPLDATRIDIVAPHLRGRAEALRGTIRDGGDALAPVLFGLGGSTFGLRRTFLLMTVSLGLALVLCLAALRAFPLGTDER